MISNILSDAVQDINEVQNDHPDTYGKEDLAAIANTVLVMDTVRLALDAVPSGDRHSEPVAALIAAVQGLDLTGVIEARKRYMDGMGL